MQEKMKRISRGMAIRMGLTMSFFLSLTGTLSSGHFTVIGFVVSFIVSTVVSILIGLVVPVGKISNDACSKVGFRPGTLGHRLFASFISNTIYTPLMTLIMVVLAYNSAMRASGGQAQIPFLPMFLRSLLISYVIGYVLVCIFMPLFTKKLMQKEGINEPNTRRDQ